MSKKLKIGVICGRFQVDELHDGHQKLINQVVQDNDMVMFVLGTTYKSKKDPLDFETRKEMIDYHFISNKYLRPIIVQLRDHKHDDIWVENLDSLVNEASKIHITAMKKYLNATNQEACSDDFEITMYGGRDSFLETYTKHNGQYDCEYVETVVCSATEIRENIKTVPNVDFRRGVIYGQNQLFPACYSVVDIIVEKYVDGELYILLGQKPIDTKKNLWVFPGGFIDKGDGSARNAAQRELKEETHLDVSSKILKIFDNVEIPDYRYEKTENSLFSTIFTVEISDSWQDYVIQNKAEAGDDLCDVKWVHHSEVENHLSHLHHVIWNIYKEQKLINVE
jgi:nicotinamide mononucleotide adenylyltransferase/8-oxo-dGTP pyrophosphatase MutT (NUDIX family)